MYLRFITQFINEVDKPETGVFNAMHFIWEHKFTQDEDESKLKELYTWFKSNLDAPPWFSYPKGYPHESKALSWFKDSAKEHILKMQHVMEILERYGVRVNRIWTREPGQIVFEDEFQISAVPWEPHRKRVV